MASLYKKKITRYVDSNGKRVSKDTPGSVKKLEKSTKWYGEYRDEREIVRSVPLCADKSAAQTMLNNLVRNVERKRVGIFDPFEQHQTVPLKQHLNDYERYLIARDNTAKHVKQTTTRIQNLINGCNFSVISDINPNDVTIWLSEQRISEKKFSAQTNNFYLDCFKTFCKWLVENERMPRNPILGVKRIRVDTDRRHDRRTLSAEEFELLIAAAERGKPIQGVNGPDRAMLYLLASWTGFRRAELASLTLKSLDLDSSCPSITVEAAYSKRRKKDRVPLHPFIINRIKKWLSAKDNLIASDLLFSLKTTKGHFRKTSKMMKDDLSAARKVWIDEASNSTERERRKESEFLCYQTSDGRFADFHSNRHTFISNLARAGVPLGTAQKLARHSDPRLTNNRYTHLELDDMAQALTSLPEPKTDAFEDQDSSLVAGMVAVTPVPRSHNLSSDVTNCKTEAAEEENPNPLREKDLSEKTREKQAHKKIHPTRFERVTFGSVDRCSIQLS